MSDIEFDTFGPSLMASRPGHDVPHHIHAEYEHLRAVRTSVHGFVYDRTATISQVRGKPQFEILPRGGETWCRIYNANDDLLGEGRAVCNKLDNFCKKIGRKIALDRALHSAGLKRSDLP